MTVEERKQARLAKLKANLVIEHDRDDEILTQHLNAAMDYAGKFQHKNNAYYSTHRMSPSTLQAVIMLASFYYESKDGGAGGFQVVRHSRRIIQMNRRRHRHIRRQPRPDLIVQNGRVGQKLFIPD